MSAQPKGLLGRTHAVYRWNGQGVGVGCCPAIDLRYGSRPCRTADAERSPVSGHCAARRPCCRPRLSPPARARQPPRSVTVRRISGMRSQTARSTLSSSAAMVSGTYAARRRCSSCRRAAAAASVIRTATPRGSASSTVITASHCCSSRLTLRAIAVGRAAHVTVWIARAMRGTHHGRAVCCAVVVPACARRRALGRLRRGCSDPVRYHAISGASFARSSDGSACLASTSAATARATINAGSTRVYGP